MTITRSLSFCNDISQSPAWVPAIATRYHKIIILVDGGMIQWLKALVDIAEDLTFVPFKEEWLSVSQKSPTVYRSSAGGWVRLVSPLPLYASMRTGSILSRPCAGNLSCCEFMSTVVLPTRQFHSYPLCLLVCPTFHSVLLFLSFLLPEPQDVCVCVLL